MADLELKPCPFCGGEAEIRFSGKQYVKWWKGFFVVGCTVCSASVCGPYYEGDPIEYDLDETIGGEKTAKRWNLRKGETDNAK